MNRVKWLLVLDISQSSPNNVNTVGEKLHIKFILAWDVVRGETQIARALSIHT